MQKDLATDILVGAADTLDSSSNVVLGSHVVLNFFVTVSLSYILNMFHPLQIMAFESMLAISYPANAIFLATAVSKIINMDVLEPNLFSKYIIGFDIE